MIESSNQFGFLDFNITALYCHDNQRGSSKTKAVQLENLVVIMKIERRVNKEVFGEIMIAGKCYSSKGLKRKGGLRAVAHPRLTWHYSHTKPRETSA